MLYTFYLLYTFYRRAGYMLYTFYRLLSPKWIRRIGDHGGGANERTVQMARGSFILTVPQAMAREAGIRKGQDVRFRVRDGAVAAGPTGIPGDGMPDSAGSDK